MVSTQNTKRAMLYWWIGLEQKITEYPDVASALKACSEMKEDDHEPAFIIQTKDENRQYYWPDGKLVWDDEIEGLRELAEWWEEYVQV